MPEKKTKERAKKKAAEGKAPTTQAGEFVKEEIEHVKKGLHGARSPKQVIAIGLSKARKAGIPLPTRGQKTTSSDEKRKPQNRPSARRSRAILNVLQREPRSSVSHKELSAQAHRAAQKRGPQARHQAALKAVKTK